MTETQFNLEELKRKINKPIILVGLMGAGKTSIGKKLATKLDLVFMDSDHEIEKASGLSISDIFSMHGEEYFRKGETSVVRRVIETPPLIKILSTGEGAFINKNTRAIIKKNGISIWLKADLDLLVKRTNRKDGRPILLRDKPRKILQKLIEMRYPVYQEADIVVETHDEPTFITLNKVLAKLSEYLK